MNRTTELKELKNAIDTAISNHERLSRSYFWHPAGSANSRRRSEERNNFQFSAEHFTVSVENSYHESCRNVYYKGIFHMDEKKVTVATIKKLSEALACLV
jgi:hypothetical protein